ncbi:hypothetical protein DB346_06585 [Verrucomicrobia bacterium LW23]|nr:hypothetical protein DB346_06585 [Verrucomicrobia bacterium LW23]
MTLYRTGQAALIALAAAAAFHIATYYPSLPAVVPTKFAFDGSVTSTMSREWFAGVYGGSVLLLLVVFLGTGLLIRNIPASAINMPNRGYWLAPERSDATRDWLAAWQTWFGVATMLFVIAMMHVVMMYQLRQIAHVNTWFYPIIGLYVLAGLAYAALFARFFRPVPTDGSAPAA